MCTNDGDEDDAMTNYDDFRLKGIKHHQNIIMIISNPQHRDTIQ
jgi:hypothetical protein